MALGVRSSSTSLALKYSVLSDQEAETLLAGANIGDSKNGWQADRAIHIGLGPVEDDYGNGEFATRLVNLIQP